MASYICKKLLEKDAITSDQCRQIEAIAATCGLIHDLGNPPFGHSGEDAIRYWFKQEEGASLLKDFSNEQHKCDFKNFEGNAQTLRIISKLQVLADYNGLNLTYGTLSAARKYVATSDSAGKNGPHSRSKPGHFASENDLIAKIIEKTGTGDYRNPITFIVEAADDIVYSVADIEDAIKKGVIRWGDVETSLNNKEDDNIKKALEGMNRILRPAQKYNINIREETRVAAFRTAAISVMVTAVTDEFISKYDCIMDGSYNGELVDSCGARSLIKTLKETARKYVYGTSSNLKLELMGRKIIVDLMTIFWEGAKKFPCCDKPKSKDFCGKIGLLFSENYIQVFQKSLLKRDLPAHYIRLQLVTDYICGMTDSFAQRMHKELSNV